VALIGVWTAHRAAKYWSTKDPQRVVIDEVSGQQLALLLVASGPGTRNPQAFRRTATPSCGAATRSAWHGDLAQLEIFAAGLYTFSSIRYLETVSRAASRISSGGLGIMADDWIAGIYAALGLWIARAVGL